MGSTVATTRKHGRLGVQKRWFQESHSHLRRTLLTGHIPLFSSSRRIRPHIPREKMEHYPVPPSQGWTAFTHTLRNPPTMPTHGMPPLFRWNCLIQRSAEHSRQPCISSGPRPFRGPFPSRSVHKNGISPRPAPLIRVTQQTRVGQHQYGT